MSGLDEAQKVRHDADTSTRVPVLYFYASAIVWLLVGTALGFISSVKLHRPEFLADCPILTFGRVRPAHLNIVAYGWASMAGIGTAIWLIARLCRTSLRYPSLVVVAATLWNLGVLLGAGGILAGDTRSVEWLEMPCYGSLLIFIAYVLIGAWTIVMFRHRQPGHLYVSLWFLFGAFFWFPWLYATANLIIASPVTGVFQEAVGSWYAHNLMGLWFSAIGLGAAYFFIPKVIGRPIHSYYLSAFGFWTFALFSIWTGMQHLSGGPFPAWMHAVSVAASFMMLIPVATTGINHHMTARDHFEMLRYSPTLRFVVFGAMFFTAANLHGVLMAIPAWGHLVQFTHQTVAHSHLGLYAFFSMTMFGAIYYIVPRLVGCEWRSAALIWTHFWGSFYGVLMLVATMFIAGISQGAVLADAEMPFIESVNASFPYLVGRSLGGMLLAGAHVVFAVHFTMMLLKKGRPCGAPTLLDTVEREGPRDPA